MDAKIGQFFDSVGSFFSGRVVIAGCERKVRDAGSEELKKKYLMRLSWALVHSRQTEDVQRGTAMLEDGVIGTGITTIAFGALGFIAGGIVAVLARKK